MLLDQKKFYQDIASYYELDNYEDLQVYLDHKEQEVKQSAMPDPGGVMCGGGDVDEDGIAAVTRNWIQERNHAIAVIIYEKARLLEKLEKWEECLAKYKEAVQMMERCKMTNLSIYEPAVDSIRSIEEEKE